MIVLQVDPVRLDRPLPLKRAPVSIPGKREYLVAIRHRDGQQLVARQLARLQFVQRLLGNQQAERRHTVRRGRVQAEVAQRERNLPSRGQLKDRRSRRPAGELAGGVLRFDVIFDQIAVALRRDHRDQIRARARNRRHGDRPKHCVGIFLPTQANRPPPVRYPSADSDRLGRCRCHRIMPCGKDDGRGVRTRLVGGPRRSFRGSAARHPRFRKRVVHRRRPQLERSPLPVRRSRPPSAIPVKDRVHHVPQRVAQGQVFAPVGKPARVERT